MKRVLLFIGIGWAFGSVHSEIVRYLHNRGIVSDMLDWGKAYSSEEMRMMDQYYDYVYSVLGETWPLTENYGIAHEKIVACAHGEYDLYHFLKSRPKEEIDRFANYAVISDFLRDLSADLGIKRVPKVVKYGVNYKRFFHPVSSALRIVGYGGSMHRADEQSIDWKRGVLAKEATEAAGLCFSPAGQFHFLAMPRYYGHVDAVLVTSSREGFGLPAIEAAAAGRLVISTPVGGFPYLASRGGGITAPIDPDEYKSFVTEKLIYYRDHPSEYREMCIGIQNAARQFDWENVIDEWIALFSPMG
jgi:Glycosyl transferases group 1